MPNESLVAFVVVVLGLAALARYAGHQRTRASPVSPSTERYVCKSVLR